MEKNSKSKGTMPSDNTIILEQMTIDPPNFEEKMGEIIPNNTNNPPASSGISSSESDTDKDSNILKTPDSVSEFGTFENDNQPKNRANDEDDNLLFSKLFPGVSREKIENDEKFKLFAKSRDKGMPFSAAYSDFLALVEKISADAIEKHNFLAQAAVSSPGPLASSDAADGGFFTKEQVLRMSREQIARNYENIRKSQERW